MVQAELERVLQGIVADLGADASVAVSYPPAEAEADYASNAALVAAKPLGKNPKDIAEVIVKVLTEMHLPFVQSVSIAGPGFINITLTREFFRDTVGRAISESERWGANASREGLRIMVEHTQPNPFKPFHIGHLMSNTIGESIARLMRFSGASVITANYQGDVGLHVAKALWGILKLKADVGDIVGLGKAYVYGNSAYEDDETAKKEIVAINKRVYENDPELLPLYAKGRDVSLAHFEDLYKTLGSTFDHYFFESEVWGQGLSLVREGLARGIFEESEGAVVFRGEKAGLHTRVFITKEGLPTYEAKDLGLAMAKLAFASFDISITTTAVEQKEYFKVIFEALAELKPELRGKFMCITHGLLQLTSGKMSSRKGNIITGESLIADMTTEARARMKENAAHVGGEVAESIGVAAIKYAILKQGLGKNIIFDPEASLSLEGDSGPYLQYAHVRAASILRKAKAEGVSADTGNVPAALSLVERMLIRFPEIVERAAAEYEPHHVAQYLTQLSGAFNSWYAADHVLDGTPEAGYKVALVDAVRLTLKNGLYLLGMRAPEEM